jgi:HK97 family phage prohead protease/HK97 family phage major capsid protein
MQKTFFIDTDEIEVKGLSDNKALKIAGYANTSDKDRTGDIVLPAAWAKGVENFRKNPILLFQHDHSKPIGKVTHITVDKKGIFVEASVSEAAETQYGVKTLINDGALKSFSVGFRVKDADYDKRNDTLYIKDVELLEISVVSIPANQNSLFSVRKSFDSDEDYAVFKQQFVKQEEDTAEEKTNEVEEVISVDPLKPIPFINLLNEDTSKIQIKDFVVMEGKRYVVDKIATADNPAFTFKECDVSGAVIGEEKSINAVDMTVVNPWDLGSAFDIIVVDSSSKSFTDEQRAELQTKFDKLINTSEITLTSLKSLQEIQSSTSLQRILNDVINLKSINSNSWNDTHYNLTRKLCMVVETLKHLPEDDNRDLMLKVYGHNIQNTTLEEKKEMTTENVGDPIIISSKANGASEVKATPAQVATVAEPRVADLVEKAGQAVLANEAAEYRSAETGKAVDSSIREELAELKGQLKAYREQISALNTSKMQYNENSRVTEQFTQRDKANAVLLAKALNRNVFDTPIGTRMKAVLTDTNLNEAFSVDVYNEMQQQLIIAPMFNRLPVNSKTFRVPVADEDTSDYVAQFPSGSFAAGVNDTTTVPTSRQAQIASVTLEPKKFMTSTHIAKDEEEDTIIPLVEFLRQAATRRLARGVDKALLRGDGSLNAFSASNALVGAGAYASVIKGVVELAASVGALVTKTGTTIDKADPGDIAAARLTLGKYGLALGENLAYITSVEGYNNLVTNTDFQTVDKFGSQATYLTGSVGAIYGIPIYISEFMDSAAAADSNLGVLVYKPGFIIGERRAMEIESEYLPQQQVTAMYLSTRIDFKALTTVSQNALSTRYAYAGLITTAS